MKTTPLGHRRHLVRLQRPGPALPDGDGGYTTVWSDLDPAELYVSILPATAGGLERITAGTVLSMASHVVTGPYHAGVTTQTRILFGDRTLNVVGVVNPDERNVETVMVAAEVVA